MLLYVLSYAWKIYKYRDVYLIQNLWVADP